jgi:hypothetical protein
VLLGGAGVLFMSKHWLFMFKRWLFRNFKRDYVYTSNAAQSYSVYCRIKGAGLWWCWHVEYVNKAYGNAISKLARARVDSLIRSRLKIIKISG